MDGGLPLKEWKPSKRVERTGLPRKWKGPSWQAERGSAAEMREKSDGDAPQLTLEDRQLKQLFAEFDLDRSGELDREEIAQVISRMGTHATEAELDAAMVEMDADGSGEVDFDEFRAWFKQSKGSASKFASVVADASRMRFNYGGLPHNWRGPQWQGHDQDAGRHPPQHSRTSLRKASIDRLSFSLEKQHAVRDWALRRLEFDRTIEEREGGITARELRAACAAETGLSVRHNDQWCAKCSVCTSLF